MIYIKKTKAGFHSVIVADNAEPLHTSEKFTQKHSVWENIEAAAKVFSSPGYFVVDESLVAGEKTFWIPASGIGSKQEFKKEGNAKTLK